MDRMGFEAMLKASGEPFSLVDQVPIRLTLHPLGNGDFGLHLQIHHIAFDGFSAGLFAKELMERLTADLPEEEKADLSDLCADSVQADDRNAASVLFYDEMFEGGVPANDLPMRCSRPKKHPLTDAVLQVTLNEKEIAALKEKAMQSGVTVFELMLSVYAAVLGQYCSCEDVVVSVPVNTRDSFSEGMIGMFVNTVPVRIRPKYGETLSDYLVEVSRTVRKATREHCLPFDTLVNRFCPDRDESRNPLFDMSFNYLRVPEELHQQGLSIGVINSMQQMSRDIGLTVHRSQTSVKIIMQYSSELYDKSLMENFLAQLLEGLHRITDETSVYTQDLTVLPKALEAQLEAYSISALAQIPDTLVHRMFEKAVRKYLDRPALIAVDGELTYSELDRKANIIANSLIARGVVRGDMIVLLLPRRSCYFATAFGVMKAGAAFIPCDPQYPQERIRLITEDSGAQYIITTADKIGQYDGEKAIDVAELLSGSNEASPNTEMSPEDLVYAIYTSGSTGKPKGVLIRHIGVCNYFTDMPVNILYHQATETGVQRVLCITTVSFDLSMKDSFGMLCNGKTLVFADEEQMNDPSALTELIERNDVHLFNGTPSRLLQYMEYPPFVEQLKKLKMIVCGGEAYPAGLRDRLQALTHAVLINTYGPTEVTISSNMADLTKADHISVGKPLLNVREFIVDAHGRLVPPGVTGELYIGGPGVARGYHNLDQQTKARFVNYRGCRCYRSGDYAKWDSEGNVLILGRMDNQVKLRGLRIELGEIEEVMESLPGIRKAVVGIRQLGEQEMLCAWYTADTKIDIHLLRDELKRKLTAYMVPVVYTRVDAIPVTANGKTDMKALPEPEISREKVIPPQNEMQQHIFDIVANVIGNTNFGIDTELYSVGLTSINSVSLSLKLTDAFSVNVQIRDFRENDTVEKLEKYILSRNNEEILPVCDEYSITKIQEGIFFETQTHTGTTIYNIPLLLELNDEIDLQRLKQAVAAAVDAHPYLNVRFYMDDQGRIRQRRADDLTFTEVDIEEIRCADIKEIRDSLVQPFDLLKDRLFRTKLIFAGQKKYLFFDAHHIVYDGESRLIMTRDISRAYAGEALKREEYSGYEAALLEERLRSGIHYERAKKYSTKLFEECDPDCMPIPDAQDANDPGSGSIIVKSEAVDTDAVSEFCAQNGISKNAFYTAAFGYTLAKYCGKDNAVFSTVNNGRNDPRFAESISMFVRTYPVLCRTDRTMMREYIREVDRQLLDSLTYDAYSFEEMRRDLGIKADILFAYQGQISAEVNEFCGLPCERIELELNEAKSAFEFLVYPGISGVAFHCSFRNNLYTEEFIRGFIQVYEQIVSEFIKKEVMADICLVSEQHKELLDNYNRTETDYDTGKTVVDLFRETSACYPDKTAIVYGDRTYTYRETDRISDNIAASLLGKKIGRGSVVSVLIGRSEYMPLVSLGILKAGAAYQPLDPTYPDERLSFMVQDSTASMLIADSEYIEKLIGWNGETMLTSEIHDLPNVETNDRNKLMSAAPKPEDLFILLYTSGSTGQPKGVMLEHQNIAAFCYQHISRVELDKNSVSAAYASYGFDANMMDMYPVFCVGAKMVIVGEEIRLDLPAILAYFKEQQVTHAFMTTQVGRQFADCCDSPYMKCIYVGGETLVPIMAKNGIRLVNVYGPTETTVYVTACDVDRPFRRVPIGKNVRNIKLYVTDGNMKRLPVGVPGELCIAGRQVSRGYLNRPEKTAEVYLANPFDTEAGYERIYRTGDTVRILPDGSIDFVGRNDGQVKIRGFRIELPEIEEIIRRFDGITDATVIGYDMPTGGKELAAYIVSADKVDIQKLKDFIRKEKPAYMVPSYIMQIDKIPLTQNQKVNRRALPKPETGTSDKDAKNSQVRDLTECEKRLLAILKESTGIDTSDTASELIALGLTSISAISFVMLIEKRFGVDIPITKLLQGMSVVDIENEIMLSLLNGKHETIAVPEKARTEFRDEYPLTPTQLGVYYETMQRPESRLYNIPLCFKFTGIDAERLAKALKIAVKAHSFLNTHIKTGKTGFMMIRNDDEEPAVAMCSIDEKDVKKHLRAFVQPFSLHTGPLYRLEVVSTAENVYMMVDFHHIVFDGFSVNLFMDSVRKAYETGSAENEEYTYFDYTLDEERFRLGEEYKVSEEYFKNMLSDFDNATEVPADIGGKAEDGSVAFVTERIDRKSVEDFCKTNRVTPSTLFLASSFYTVSRFAAVRDTYITTISNGRSVSKTRGAVGMFVRTLPVAMRPKDGMSVMDYIKAAMDTMNGSIVNEMYPFTEIAGKYGYGTGVMYECQLGVVSEIRLDGHTAENIPVDGDAPKFKLKIVVTDGDDGICLRIGYNDALYSEKYMQTLVRSLKICTERMIEAPAAPVSHLSLLSEEEAEKLECFSRTQNGPIPGGGLIHRMFEDRVALHPDRDALIAIDGKLTYHELNRKANIIANNLMDRGVHKGDMIVLLLPRRSYYFAALLGVLKAGAAFIPCDPQYPSDRIRLITEDSGAQYIVTTLDKIGQYAGGKAIDIAELLKGENDENPQTEMTGEDLAYAIYTSGSTGKPKGVLIRHEGVCNYFSDSEANILYNKAAAMHVRSVLCITTIAFDMSMKDALGMICNGITTVFADEEQMNDPLEITKLMEEYGTELFSSTPSRLIQYLDYPAFADQIKKQKIVICGAEMYPMSLKTTLKQLTDAELFNSYGPTEITVSSNMAHLTNADHISVGKPLYNYVEYIVDTDDNVIPIGVTGELYVGGPGVAKGYQNLEEMTRDRFVDYNGMRVYKTGDYAKWDEEGNVIILGRKDNQVKLRGLRIELGEIESLIAQQPSIKQVLVLIKKINGQDNLCAYYTASEKVDGIELQKALKTKLTHYMVPTAYLQLDAFPVNANGKTDRKALPEPELVRASEYIEASGEVERFFCDVFAKALKMDRVGAEDNFFECGGSSLTVTSVVVAAVEAGYQLSYSDVFLHSSPRSLADFVTGQKKKNGDSEIEDYDYSIIDKVLARNTISSYRSGEMRELGNILLTGATGYMGIHVLYHFLTHETGKVYCLLRKGRFDSPKTRLKNLMFYYFQEEGLNAFDERVEVLNGDVTKYSDFEPFEQYPIDTVFNCAANVKHFSTGTDIEDVNIGGVENCIRFCRKMNARLIHFSTVSTAGEIQSRDGSRMPVFDENTLYLGQVLDNKYAHSKFIAERMVLTEIAKGLDAKIIRVGTLAPRKSDGEFQINYLTNSFMGRLRTYALVGVFPYSVCQHVIRMGAIDVSVDAFMKLAKTPSACCLFNACNNHTIFLSDIIASLRERGRDIRFVEKETFDAELMNAAEDPAKAAIISSLIAYSRAQNDEQLKPVPVSCSYTNDILSRTGFLWDITDKDYVDRFLTALDGMFFFDSSNLIR